MNFDPTDAEDLTTTALVRLKRMKATLLDLSIELVSIANDLEDHAYVGDLYDSADQIEEIQAALGRAESDISNDLKIVGEY